MFRVLLVEDNPENAQLTRSRLAGPRSPWEVEQTETLQGALTFLGKGGADVVLLDLQLPDARGLDAVNRLSSAFPAVPLVVMTSHHDEAMGVVALQKGAQDYVVRSQIDRHGLDRSLKYAIERARASMAEALYSSAFASSRDPIVTTDLTGRITGWSPAAAAAYGLSSEEMLGQPIQDLVLEGGEALQAATLARALEGERVLDVAVQHRRKDGAAFGVTLTASPLKGASGRTLGAMIVVRVSTG